jgi:hypothetical protein
LGSVVGVKRLRASAWRRSSSSVRLMGRHCGAGQPSV